MKIIYSNTIDLTCDCVLYSDNGVKPYILEITTLIKEIKLLGIKFRLIRQFWKYTFYTDNVNSHSIKEPNMFSAYKKAQEFCKEEEVKARITTYLEDQKKNTDRIIWLNSRFNANW